MFEKVKNVIENKISPALQMEGGQIELIDIQDGKVSVKLSGACAGCPRSSYTLKSFVESVIKQEVPEVKEVIAVNL